MIKPISAFLENTGCFLDAYADASGTYLINSLYLDSPTWLFLRKNLNGDLPRCNMRIRSYGSNPKPPYFLEVKYKECGIVKKIRHPINAATWEQYFDCDNPVPFSADIESNSANYRTIERMARTYNVEPKLLTQYRRKAYLSQIDDYARVTFDTDLRFQQVEGYTINPCELAMSNYDNPLVFKDDSNTVLELKCTTQVPLWMVDMIRVFNLDRGSFSKYASSSLELLGLETFHRFDRERHF